MCVNAFFSISQSFVIVQCLKDISIQSWHSLPHSPLIYYNIIMMSMDCCVITVPKTMRSRTAGLKAIFPSFHLNVTLFRQNPLFCSQPQVFVLVSILRKPPSATSLWTSGLLWLRCSPLALWPSRHPQIKECQRK